MRTVAMNIRHKHNLRITFFHLSLIFLSLVLFIPASGQRNLVIPDSISNNFHKEVQLRQRYWDTVGVNRRKGDFKHFNRWRYFWEARVNADGSYPTGADIHNAFQMGITETRRQKSNKFQSMPEWTDVGNRKNPTGNLINGGVGRVNAIRPHPANADEIWAGAANGGVWRSTGKGALWTPLYQTEFLSMGVSDIGFSKSNPSVVYVATGDFDGSVTNNQNYSVGIIKTTDGGQTWNTTQNAYTLPENRVISRVWVHPENENIVIATTGSGIIKTTDGGQTWESKTSGGGSRFADLEQKPGDPNVLYASTSITAADINSSTYVYKTTDGGETWTEVRRITGGGKRTCLAVTPAAPNSVYALTANEQNGYHSLIISEDGGTNWNLTNVYSSQRKNNYLGWEEGLSNRDGQGHYDLALAVNPEDANMIFIGGVNIWRSIDKGNNFTMVAHWASAKDIPYVHADIHDLIYINQELYVGHDGGVDYTTNSGQSWTQRYEGMGINQIYSISTSPHDYRNIIIGLQDLGTIRKDTNDEWHYVSGGDGMQCYFDPKSDKRYYSSLYEGLVYKFEIPDGGGEHERSVIIRPEMIENRFGPDTGAWVTAFAISPMNPNKIYVGYSNIYYHPDYGVDARKWVKQTNNNYSYSSTFRHIRIYPKDDNIVYASTLSNITKTVNGGTNWTFLTLPPGAGSITNIAIHPDDPEVLYVTFGGYTDKSKLFKWDGSKWINLSGNLPNVPAVCVTPYVDGGFTKLYVGTDIGVYYGIDAAAHFVKWGTGLPHLIVSQIEVFPEHNLLRAATYGRGIWETSLQSCPHGTIEIKADGDTNFCINDSLRLYVETPNAADVLWSTGETGNEIWVKNEGTYSAISGATTECFNYSNELSTTLKIVRRLDAEANGAPEFCTGDSVTLTASGSGLTDIKWSTGETARTITVKEAGNYYASGLNSNGCISYSEVITVLVSDPPAQPSINYHKFDVDNPANEGKPKVDTLEASVEAAAYQWYLDDKLVPSANTRRITVDIVKANEGNWTVAVGVNTGCFSAQSEPQFINDIKEMTDVNFEISPNPATDDISIKLDAKYWGKYSVNILNVQGAIVKTIDEFDVSDAISTLNITDLAAGSYVVRISNSTQSFSKAFIKIDK